MRLKYVEFSLVYFFALDVTGLEFGHVLLLSISYLLLLRFLLAIVRRRTDSAATHNEAYSSNQFWHL